MKQDNQDKQRDITKDKYTNKREDEEKKYRKEQEALKLEIDKVCEKIEHETTLLEFEVDRNADPNLLKNTKVLHENLK